jgi:hypothetical protein
MGFGDETQKTIQLSGLGLTPGKGDSKDPQKILTRFGTLREGAKLGESLIESKVTMQGSKKSNNNSPREGKEKNTHKSLVEASNSFSDVIFDSFHEGSKQGDGPTGGNAKKKFKMLNDICEVKAKSSVFDQEEKEKGIIAMKKPGVESSEIQADNYGFEIRSDTEKRSRDSGGEGG